MLNAFYRSLGVLPAIVLLFSLADVRTANAEFIYVTLQTSVARFDISSGNAATIAASKATVASGLDEAMGLVFAGDGSLYVSQFTPNTVSRITSGSVASFASGFTSPRGITMSGTAGNFYVANSNAPGSISQVTPAGSVSTFLSSGVNAPYGVAFDGSGALYATNNASYSITKIVGGVPSTFATFNPGEGVRAVAVAANGNVFSAGNFGVNVTTQAGSTTNFASGIGFAYGLAFNSTGNLFVADYTNQTIRAYNPSGSLLYSFSTGAGTTNRPRYVAFDSPGSGFNQIVPEPSTCAMALAVLACGGFSMWRRRKRA
ncbi:MAG: PEP-CTERM sorting domain-containing protein [Planctomycetia bacterium]